MMVAFRYDNGAVGSLSYSREIPSLLGACGCRSSSAATASSRSSRTALFVLVRGDGAAAADRSRASATSAATRRCTATSSRAIREGRAPEMSLERAMDDQRLMDADLREPAVAAARRDADRADYDIVIIGSGAGGGTMAHALAPTGARILDPRARRLRPAGRRELEPRRGLEAPALPDDGALARRARPRVPAVHALQRRRQHEVLGQRALPPAARGLPGASSTWTACRRRGRSTTTRSRRTTTRRAAVPRARRSTASIRPSRRAGRIRIAPVPHAPAWRDIVDRLRRAGPASLAAAARAAPRRAGRLHPLQHLQLVSVQDSREERRRSLLRSAARRRSRT